MKNPLHFWYQNHLKQAKYTFLSMFSLGLILLFSCSKKDPFLVNSNSNKNQAYLSVTYAELKETLIKESQPRTLCFFSKQHLDKVQKLIQEEKQENLLLVCTDYPSSDKSYLEKLNPKKIPLVLIDDPSYLAYKTINPNWDGLSLVLMNFKDNSFEFSQN
ncbi:MAG: hypothetical protein C4K58_03455 [Flavobacteriaceae bacterium]|nr:MAG: hypothetical protein C4K58_03455 [Flavobacteriaceae bacterium]